MVLDLCRHLHVPLLAPEAPEHAGTATTKDVHAAPVITAAAAQDQGA
jgi:hypothetical protein